ncbi:MAG: hypothetical protein E5V56_12920, partial [Mesorhizobium sp.]
MFAIFMPGSCWNLKLGKWFAGEGLATKGHAARRQLRTGELATMLRTIVCLSAVVAGLVSSGAFAAPSGDG